MDLKFSEISETTKAACTPNVRIRSEDAGFWTPIIYNSQSITATDSEFLTRRKRTPTIFV